MIPSASWWEAAGRPRGRLPPFYFSWCAVAAKCRAHSALASSIVSLMPRPRHSLGSRLRPWGGWKLAPIGAPHQANVHADAVRADRCLRLEAVAVGFPRQRWLALHGDTWSSRVLRHLLASGQPRGW